MIQVAIIENDPNYLHCFTRVISEQSDMNCLHSKLILGDFYHALDLGAMPDVLVLNQHIGLVNSLDHLEKMYKLMPGVLVVMLAELVQPDFIRKALKLGVSGYLLKQGKNFPLLKAVREAIAGNAFLSPEVAKVAIEMIQKNENELSPELYLDQVVKRLPWNATKREINVIGGLIEGKSYKEIAASNYMTIDGVRYYIRSIYPKLGVSTRDQLVRKLKG